MVRSGVGLARDVFSDPPLDTGTNACSLQDAVEGSEPGLLDLVRLVLRTAGPRFEGRRTRFDFITSFGEVAAAGPIEGLAELGVVCTNIEGDGAMRPTVA